MRAKTIAVVAGSMALLALLPAASASARTRGFTIYNLTSQDLRVTEVTEFATPADEPVFEQGSIKPRKGMVLQPGEKFHYELENPFSYTRRAIIDLEGGGTSFHIWSDNYFATRCSASGGGRRCSLSDNGNKLVFLDPPGTVNVIGPNELQEQAKVLKELCTPENDCGYEPLKRFKTRTAGNALGSAVVNCGKSEVKTKLTVSEKFGITNSVGIEAETGVNFFDLFKAKVTVKYKIEISEEREFAQDVEANVEPRSVAWVTVGVPVIRDLGDFTLHLGNTVWKLEGVSFDSPNPDKNVQGEYIVNQSELPKEQFDAKCKNVPPGSDPIVKGTAANIATHDHGSAAADLMVGGPESNTLHGHGGHDVIRGGGGEDRLLGGGGDDAIKGGPGADVLSGGSGADRIEDVSGPTVVHTGDDAGPARDRVDVADGRADDVVTCQTSLSTVYADPGDKVGDRCGRVLRFDPGTGA